MSPTPQEGDRDFRTANSQWFCRAISVAVNPPVRYASVTSPPAAVTTLPSRISAAGRGIGNPPRTSGQTAIAWPASTIAASVGQEKAVPSKRQATPARQALTTIIARSLDLPQ